MLVPWLCVALCVSQCAGGGSLRGAVEALQRRQRGQGSPGDYDAIYEFVPPGYSEPDYAVDVDYANEEPRKYIVKLLDENDRVRPLDGYEYQIVKKDNRMQKPARKETDFSERSHKDNDKLKDLFNENNDRDERKEDSEARTDNEAEYELLLNQLWSKYKNNKAHNNDNSAPQGMVKLYKEKAIKKRYAGNWGPIAYKRKRRSGYEQPPSRDYEPERKDEPDSNYNAYDSSNSDNNDWREEYTIAFQPLDDDSVLELEPGSEDKYSIDSTENRFPVTKRSSGSYEFNDQKKRLIKNRSDKTRRFRSSSGTDPRIIQDLSKIFGESVEIIKTPVKRNTDHQSSTPEGKPPKLTVVEHNNTHGHPNYTHYEVESHEQHQGHMHHPGHEGMKEVDPDSITHDQNHDKPITVRKKSIDWSDYFGIDKRARKFLKDGTENQLKKQYFDTFNKEVIYPQKTFRKHSFVKRNYGQVIPDQESERNAAHTEDITEEDKRTAKDDSKLESLDKRLKAMEGMLVDEALHYSDSGEDIDSKDEQEMKEKLLSQLAAAYSLEKMRKALKDFKQNLQTQKSKQPTPPTDEMKVKRVAIKKELMNNDIPAFNKQPGGFEEFEEEQGAGHYLNGREQQFSEGYMGSGRHRSPVSSTVGAPGSCPVLAKIVHRCRSVDILAGDRGQLLLPLCSLYQICYLCGQAPPTTCDMLFISEADTFCEGNMSCQQSARVALMALRDLHDNLSDELDGECETSPCLSQTLKLNPGWQKALQK